MGNSQGHSHSPFQYLSSQSLTTAFYIGIALNSLFVIIELIFGISRHSLSLISDAGHNFFDVFCLVLALFSVWLCSIKTSDEFAFGYKKVSIVVAFFNSAVLLSSVVVIFYDAILRLYNPTPLEGKTIAGVAFAGILINGISAFFFLRHKNKDINVKSAYWHLLADALLSFAVCVGGILIYYTGYSKIDAWLSMLITVIIAWSSWKLLKESFELLIGKTPSTINKEEIQYWILEHEGIQEIKHLKIWAISTNEFVANIQIIFKQEMPVDQKEQTKEQIKKQLALHRITQIFWE